MKCPHCHLSLTGSPEFCTACRKILPPISGRSPYEVLGYEREILDLDLQDLEKRFFELSKKFHPDRFAGKSPEENQYSHGHSSEVNNAYRTLKNPASRAKYFVEKRLGSFEEKSASVPADMAELFFEIHDHLDSIRDANGNPPAEALKAVQSAETDLKEKVRSLETDLQQKFISYDNNPEPKMVLEMKEILSQRSYIQSFLRQIDNTFGRD